MKEIHIARMQLRSRLFVRRFLGQDLRTTLYKAIQGVQKRCLRPGPQVADSKRLDQPEELVN
jgi:hypothetical protein